MRKEPLKEVPWYKRTVRWGQTNFTEMDPVLMDLDMWKEYWLRTRVQGLIINTGGIVAYYASSLELQYRAQGLGDQDFLGRFISQARQEGLTVLARMDINRATKEFYEIHPDWFVVHADGQPHTSNGRYFSCVNSDYYKKFIPQVLGEIIRLYQPDGFTDNSWTGVSRHIICHCGNCMKKFKEDSGHQLPLASNWDDPIYRTWIKWNYKCRMENWDLFNQVTQQLGGPDCLWLGMVHGSPINSHFFCDLKEVGERSRIVMCDHQSRTALDGFEMNGLSGNLLHSLAGWDNIVTESMANYLRGTHMFRKASNPPKETQMWMIEGMTGGISPWYHHIGAVHEDNRQFDNAPPIMQWHQENEEYLYNRLPVANIGLVWSQDNTDFYGRGEARDNVALPWHGFVKALTRARIPYVPIHADHISRDTENLDVLILPDLAVMTDAQCEAVERFVESGGSLIFTGATATLDQWGEKRDKFPLESITGIKHLGTAEGLLDNKPFNMEVYNGHNYIRLPEDRHAVVSSFKNTDILPFGGKVHLVQTSKQLSAVATYIPGFPIYPPEFSWMREPTTDIPVMLAGEHPSGGRIFYFAGDVDRCYGRTHIPDLGDLLSNAVKWAAADTIPLQIEGPGYLDCKLYRQNSRLILHLVNLSGANQTPGFLEEYLPVGPIKVRIRVDGFVPNRVRMKVRNIDTKAEMRDGWVTVQMDSLVDHELMIFE
jgi:hypothetical protein